MEETQKAPVFLKVLCILTFVGSGLGLLFSLLAVVGMGALMSSLSQYGLGGEATDGTMYLLVGLLVSAASVFGAIQMLKLKKMGFYIYAVAQVIGLVMGFGIISLIITGGFIAMYAINLKHMS